jgi:hypothetical protein
MTIMLGCAASTVAVWQAIAEYDELGREKSCCKACYLNRGSFWMQRWQVEYLENQNYKRTKKQIQYVMNHLPRIEGWSKPKPVTDLAGWGMYGGTPWSPGVYRLQHYDNIDHRALPVINKNGDDPEGVLYIGKAETWLWARITNIRNVSCPHWRWRLAKQNRCIVPATSFCE